MIAPRLGFWTIVVLSLKALPKKETIMESTARDYAKMELKDLIEAVIEDSKKQGTITYPLRTEGYHTCSNLIYTDRL